MEHKLTVLLTVYNIGEYLQRFFECMQRQTFTDYCLLILDDGSEDHSLDVCKQFAEKDDRIEIIELHHVGISKARNIGIQHINTPLTAFADGDDYFEDDYLKHLVDAAEESNADLVISRVEYIKEGESVPHDVHLERGNTVIFKEDFNKMLPMLLDDRRLNYLYAKMFRTELLKPLRVEDDVRQGSDTMFVFQYLYKANSIALIDNVDYHYIKYQSRSVTSYSGTDAFERLLRINRFIRSFSEGHGMMTEELNKMIDGRILISAIWIINTMFRADTPIETKESEIDKILNNEEHLEAYNRQKDNFDIYRFEPIEPQSGENYFKQRLKEENLLALKGKISEKLPNFVLDLYRTIFR